MPTAAGRRRRRPSRRPRSSTRPPASSRRAAHDRSPAGDRVALRGGLRLLEHPGRPGPVPARAVRPRAVAPEPVVTAFRAWTDVGEQLSAAREMARDPDDEVRAMAREEVGGLEAREAALSDELRTLLLPRDPNDEQQRDPRDPRRHRRRRGRAVRGRPVPDVRPLRRAAALEDRGAVVDESERRAASRRSIARGRAARAPTRA